MIGQVKIASVCPDCGNRDLWPVTAAESPTPLLWTCASCCASISPDDERLGSD